MSGLVTRLDLSTVETWVEPVDMAIWHKVEYNGDRYLLVATSLEEEDLVSIMEKDPISGLMYVLGQYPMKDTAVFRADSDWQIIGECGEECASGVCSRRVATNSDRGDIELAYVMLVDFLNA